MVTQITVYQFSVSDLNRFYPRFLDVIMSSEFSLSFCLDFFESFLSDLFRSFSIREIQLIDHSSKQNRSVGMLTIVRKPCSNDFTLKRTADFNSGYQSIVNKSGKIAKKFDQSFVKSEKAASDASHTNFSKDVGQVFKDLNLFPEIPNDLQCALCPYRATMKGNLKTHYKLKHLGGGGLAMNCTICEQKFATKGNLKRHMTKVHNLSGDNVDKLLA